VHALEVVHHLLIVRVLARGQSLIPKRQGDLVNVAGREPEDREHDKTQRRD